MGHASLLAFAFVAFGMPPPSAGGLPPGLLASVARKPPQLLHDELLTPEELLRPRETLPLQWVHLAHDEEYYEGFCTDSLPPNLRRRIGFTQRPSHAALLRRTQLEVLGTVQAARMALEEGMAGNCAGGTHHAHRAYGSGYTALNDLAIAAKVLLEEALVDRLLICDLDVHQGDGTAEILQDEPRAFTMSVHCKDNFPFGFKGMTHLGHDRSDLDVALAKGTEDKLYLATVAEHLQGILEDLKPDLVLYDAGVDVHVEDDLGNLCISWEGLQKREELVLELCSSKAIPVAFVIGGGYHRDAKHLAKRHAMVFHAAAKLYSG